jgi:hypothetical protein
MWIFKNMRIFNNRVLRKIRGLSGRKLRNEGLDEFTLL